ncbi:efflux RND transporter periplasmic adaptor subunit [Roseicitreum antarcticum]|uniref:RND family efflux transporter, MFP subunit n=1 Tax=Roseicitreum antarcticum TaxID=564137 RepID=A0A1H2Z8W4_9RHOB|nr:efflux RND transporter periplasmic adaptor subunit [Roseicitreum antarcticum]SDX13294.1 RND family efflux transporter, MFP subunit [Roseicitreum antarcticum]
MRILRDAIVSAVALVLALTGWAMFFPAAHPYLDRVGILAPMQAAGIPLAQAEAPASGGRGFGGGATTVIARSVGLARTEDRVTAIGTGRAQRSVVITPQASGRLVALPVRPGTKISEGTVIAQLDSQEEQIALDRAEVVLEDARRNAERQQRLQGSGAISDAQVQSVELALRNAELGLRQAEFDLQRRSIVAPFDGALGLLNYDVGDQVGTASDMTQLEDRSVLLIDFSVPERFVGQLDAGDPVQVAPLSRPDDRFTGHVLAVDSRVDPASRTLRVQAQVDNSADRLRGGMAFSISVALPGEELPLVDPLAIQWGRDGPFVWALDDTDAVQQVRIEIVQRRDTTVLVRAGLREGDRVVVEGVQNLRPGGTVSLQEIRPAPSAETRTETGAATATTTDARL